MLSASKEKLVSIVIPTYNGSRFIEQTLESCLSQSYSNIEVIVVNDGSTDNTADIIDRFSKLHPNITSVSNHANKNLPYSLNRGFEVAKGEYFTWISDDNLYSENTIEEMVKNLESDSYDLVYSSYEMIDESGNVIDRFGYEPCHIIFKCVVGACFLYKKEIHKKLNGYREDKFRMEDYDFWMRALPDFTFLYIDKPHLYKYRKHTKNLTSRIFQDPHLFNVYKSNYIDTFGYFFNNRLNAGLTNEQSTLHADIFFDSIIQTRSFETKDIHVLNKCLEHFDCLKGLNWELVGLNTEQMQKTIDGKTKEFFMALVSTLIFENTVLKKKNPKLSKVFSNSIFWYYKEYETLPKWFKRVGHVIKILQGNKPLPFLDKATPLK